MAAAPSVDFRFLTPFKLLLCDTPPSSFNMAERGKKRYKLSEAVEAIYADEDSENENYDCGSDVDFVSNSEDESVSEESDLDVSLTLPKEKSTVDEENFTRSLIGKLL